MIIESASAADSSSLSAKEVIGPNSFTVASLYCRVLGLNHADPGDVFSGK